MKAAWWMAVLLSSCALFSAGAQTPAEETDDRSEAEKILSRPLGELRFEVSTVGEVCAILSEKLQGSATIIVKDEVADEPVKFSLNQANLFTTMGLLMQLAPVEVLVNSEVGFMHLDFVRRAFAEGNREVVPDSGQVTILVKESAEGRAGRPTEPPSSVHVYNVSLLMKESTLSVDDLATAIETAWGDPEDGVELKFHADTGLLFCSGREDRLEMVDQLLFQLPGGPDTVFKSIQSRPGSKNLTSLKEMMGLPLPDQEREDWIHKLRTLEREIEEQRNRFVTEIARREDQIMSQRMQMKEIEMDMSKSRQEWELARQAEEANREIEHRTRIAELQSVLGAKDRELDRLQQKME